MVRVLRAAGIAGLVLWLAGVSGALDWVPVTPTVNWAALLAGASLLALAGLAAPD